MKTGSQSAAPDYLDFNLPEEEGCASELPRCSAIEMVRLCETMLPVWNKQRFVDGEETPGPSPKEFKI